MPMIVWLRTVGKYVGLSSALLPGERFANMSNWICVTEEAGERSLTELSRVGTRWPLAIGVECWVLLAVLSPTTACWLDSSASCPLLVGVSPPEPPLTEQPSWAFALKPSAPKEISKQALPPSLLSYGMCLVRQSPTRQYVVEGEIAWHQLMCCTQHDVFFPFLHHNLAIHCHIAVTREIVH